MWILCLAEDSLKTPSLLCLAEDSLETSSLIFSEKKNEKIILNVCSCDWRFKGSSLNYNTEIKVKF